MAGLLAIVGALGLGGVIGAVIESHVARTARPLRPPHMIAIAVLTTASLTGGALVTLALAGPQTSLWFAAAGVIGFGACAAGRAIGLAALRRLRV